MIICAAQEHPAARRTPEYPAWTSSTLSVCAALAAAAIKLVVDVAQPARQRRLEALDQEAVRDDEGS